MHINEIFKSISGEVGSAAVQGQMCHFVRMQGCNLRCCYCDALDATGDNDKHGKYWTASDVLVELLDGCRTPVVITGGEPLLQEEAVNFLAECLLNKGHAVQIETNGTIFPKPVPGVNYVVDYKLSGSEIHEKNRLPLDTYAMLPEGSWIKLVVSNGEDFREGLAFMREIRERWPLESSRLKFALGCTPNYGPERLFHEILVHWESLREYQTVMNVQIHKYVQAR